MEGISASKYKSRGFYHQWQIG